MKLNAIANSLGRVSINHEIRPDFKGIETTLLRVFVVSFVEYHEIRPDFKGIETVELNLILFSCLYLFYHEIRPDFKGIETLQQHI